LAGWLGTCAYLRDIAPTPREAMAKIADYEAELASYARERFAERAPHVRLYGRPPNAGRLPLFAFNITGVASDELAARFDRAGVEARVGDYLSPRLMHAVARDAHGRAIRISFAHYTTTADIDRCFDVVDAASERQPQGVTG
jgi:selenocysteine lyase/cysteine desulfurase